MNEQQAKAINNHCRLACETAQQQFAYLWRAAGVSVVLTVNTGYE